MKPLADQPRLLPVTGAKPVHAAKPRSYSLDTGTWTVVNWRQNTKSLICHFQELDDYAKYANLDEFFQWAAAEGYRELADIRKNDAKRSWCLRELVSWRKDHVSSWILYIYARGFSTSGTALLKEHLQKGSRPPGSVVYFLFGRGIELFLKAFLVALRDTAGNLRETYGHDLSRLLAEARRRKLGRYVPLKSSEVSAVKILSVSYADKQLEYPVLDGQMRPDHTVIAEVAQRWRSASDNIAEKRPHLFCVSDNGPVRADVRE